MDRSKILFTGGSGLLGSTFKRLEPRIQYPSQQEFDVTDLEQMRAFKGLHDCCFIIHAAAFTSPPQIDKDPAKALATNIVGTANVVRICMEIGARLIYISTDYVFRGDTGMYDETDAVYPVNKYAWSKLGGECAVRLYDKSLIVRTTFGPDIFPYPKAFNDQWTSRESVSVISAKIQKLIDTELTGVIHVGGDRKTVHQYATRLDPAKQIGQLSVKDVSFAVPVDTSLDCTKYNQLIH